MNIEVAKSDLELALKVAGTTVASGTDLSAHYLFRIVDGKAEVLSYDARVFSCSPFVSKVEGNEGDAFTVEAWRLDKWVASVGDGVLALTSNEGGEVTAKGPRSRIKLRSLDPTRFPYWDGLLSDPTEMGTIDAATLHRALSLTKSFISMDDTNRPELCQTEAREGVLQATNRVAVSSVTLRHLPDLSMRIPGKDVGIVLKFLSDKTTAESPVKVLHAEREGGNGAAVVFSRPDGSYVGVSRPTAALPQLPMDAEDTDIRVLINVEEFTNAVDVLLASAPKNHPTVTFASKDGGLVVSMPSEAGGHDEFPLIHSTEENMGDLTFTIDYAYVRSIADQFDLDAVAFGVHLRGKGGYLTFSYDDGTRDLDGDGEGEGGDGTSSGNLYHTVIVWRA